MDLHQDFVEILRELFTAKARFLIVGAHAVNYHHPQPRYTKDLDVWVEPSPENAQRVWAALARFGAALKNIAPDDFTNPAIVYQMGIEPLRVDILTGIEGCDFERAWRRRVRADFGGIAVYVLSRADLIRAKRATGRPQDLLDVRNLTARPKRLTRRRSRRPHKR